MQPPPIIAPKGGQAAVDREVAAVMFGSLEAAVRATRDAGASGWVITDPGSQFSLPRESVKALAPIEE
jgi:hypothetical protein